MIKHFDYLIVGSGLYGATIAHELVKAKKRVLVIEKRDHIGGNIYTENIDGINVHVYGAHIFHTSNKEVWDYVNSIVPFNHFINSPLAFYKGNLYHLPFNMYTFQQIFGVTEPEKAKAVIAKEIEKENIKDPKNLEEKALSLVGRTIYEKLIKGYTEKQWGQKATELPPFIIQRVPLRFEFNNNYFDDIYQGIPIGGYTNLIKKLLIGAEVLTSTDFFKDRVRLEKIAEKIIYTGSIDEFFNYKLGALDYRSLRFETKRIAKEYYQNNCVINYTEYQIPYTRIIEHKYFEDARTPFTIITKEYPDEYKAGKERYYPINNDKNNNLYAEYNKLKATVPNVIFGGRLGNYKYYDMDDTILKALEDAKNELKEG